MPAKPTIELIISEETVPDSTVILRYFKFERFVECSEYAQPLVFAAVPG